ncbi:hypothetical protein G6L68_10275 [Agrobacterium fabrum]|uniref:hypothetical protein n=1 Tax=Agrobacterium fabrum TaxID=1176649 RepID=UPI000EF6253E|nr:hypothetical protein [Agrobacterium fabrum]AYM62930.1 hypothetical protein At12D13_17650 [Agrobacterium fabrum]NTE61029.1 hypothetical protein [Agrobacterium fabrum]
MNAWATTIISGLVLVVAFMQWRTAHQKVVLELFERRLRIYDSVAGAVEAFAMAGPWNEYIDARRRLQSAMSQARFLFGDEVLVNLQAQIDDMAEYIQKIQRVDSQTAVGSKRRELIDELELISERIDAWFAPFSDLCYPYIRMDQKLIRTPVKWARDKNKTRLSYADEKQK